jgi:hypothetical protein
LVDLADFTEVDVGAGVLDEASRGDDIVVEEDVMGKATERMLSVKAGLAHEQAVTVKMGDGMSESESELSDSEGEGKGSIYEGEHERLDMEYKL